MKARYKVNENGVVQNPDEISIPIPKSIASGGVKVNIELAECDEGWASSHLIMLPTCGSTTPIIYSRGDYLHSSAAEAAMGEANRLVAYCQSCGRDEKGVNAVIKSIENFMDDIRLGIAELPGVEVLKQVELF